ncbi:MAG: flagellar basal body-associated FliL family protein [Bryobacterales bacterium]
MNSQHVFKKGTIALALGLLLAAMAGCSSDAEAAAEEPDARPGVLQLESFLTNINDPSGERYCKLTIKLAITPAGEVGTVEGDPLLLARMRDQVLTLLSGKTFYELSDPKGKETFREEVRTRLGELLKGSEIQQVLFSEFVVQ